MDSKWHVKMMRRVVHTIPSVAEESSGYAKMALELCQSMATRGVRTELATLDRDGHREVPAFVKRFAPSAGPKRLGLSSHMHRWLRAGGQSGEIGILHSHSIWSMATVYPAWVARKYWTPYVVSTHGALADAAFQSGSRVKAPFWHLVQQPALLEATCFHATCDEEMRDIRRRGFIQPVAVIPIGIDVPELDKRPSTEKTMLYLSRIHPIKRPDMLLRAWASVSARHPDWRLRIVGPDNDSPGYLAEMRELARSLGVRKVAFEGELLGDAKLEAYRSADVYVLPSRSENFGITVTEALAAGTPVIVTKGAPWREVPERGAGWWVDGSQDALEGAMHEAMSTSRPALAEMGARGHLWMKECFQRTAVSDRMIDLYEWIMTGMEEAARPAWVHSIPGWESETARQRRSLRQGHEFPLLKALPEVLDPPQVDLATHEGRARAASDVARCREFWDAEPAEGRHKSAA
jgi:glycosyltransferase involved in cell wall biosynthesis